MIKKYKIEVDQPDDVSDSEMKEYIRDAVSGWSGQFHPDDPLFAVYGDDNPVVVKHMRKPKKKTTPV